MGSWRFLVLLLAWSIYAAAADDSPVDSSVGNYYELLGVPADCSLRELKKAYRKAALAHHPDKFSGLEEKKTQEQLFVKIVKAYETLSDESSRQAYDDFIAKGGTDYDSASDRDYQSAYARWKQHEEAERRSLILGGGGTLACLLATGYFAYKEANRRTERRKRQREALVGTVQSLGDQEQKALEEKKRHAQLRQDAKRRGREEAEQRKLESQQREVVKVDYSPSETSQALSEESKRFRDRIVKTSQWSVDETSALARAIAKYPGGTSSRWERVMEYVNAACNNADGAAIRSEKDCTKMARLVKSGIIRPGDPTDSVHAHSAPKVSPGAPPQPSEKTEVTEATPSVASVSAPGSGSAAVEWSAEQQRQLETALKQFPPKAKVATEALDSYDRWTLVAQNVSGKTKKQCIARFKEIRSRMLQK